MMRFALGVLLVNFAVVSQVSARPQTTAPASALAPGKPEALEDVGVTEKLGENVSIRELKFRDETGREVALAEYFHKGRPVLINLVYFECPGLCNFILNGMVDSLKTQAWQPGQQYDILTVSFNPAEKPELAAAKKESYLKVYGRPEVASGWHFLTGDEANIKRLTSELGFKYKYVEEEKQYAHGAISYVLTPEGKISRVVYGISFPERDLKLALLEASSGKIGTITDRLLLFCFHYDPKTRKYSVYAMRMVQTGAAGTMVVFGGYLAIFWRRQRNRKSDQGENKA